VEGGKPGAKCNQCRSSSFECLCRCRRFRQELLWRRRLQFKRCKFFGNFHKQFYSVISVCKAVARARAHDLSVALFAQGWVHECWAQENFTPLEYEFWWRLWSMLFVHGPSQLPFETSFCQGYGLKKYDFGKVCKTKLIISIRENILNSTFYQKIQIWPFFNFKLIIFDYLYTFIDILGRAQDFCARANHNLALVLSQNKDALALSKKRCTNFALELFCKFFNKWL
jgi:hypothetical protein